MTVKDKVEELLKNGKITEEQACFLMKALKEDGCLKEDFSEKMRDFESRFENDAELTSDVSANGQGANNEERFECAEQKRDFLEEKTERLNDLLDELQDRQDDIFEARGDTCDEWKKLDEEIRRVTAEAEAAQEELDNLEDDYADDLRSSLAEAFEQVRKIADVCKTVVASGKFSARASETEQRISVEKCGDAVVVRSARQSGKPYEQQTVYVKYLHEDFRLTGDFPTGKGKADNVYVKYVNGNFRLTGDVPCEEEKADTATRFLTENARNILNKLLEEKFSGDFKYVCEDEILKVTIQ